MQKITLKYSFIRRQTFFARHIGFGIKLAWIPRELSSIDLDAKTIEIPMWMAIKQNLQDFEAGVKKE